MNDQEKTLDWVTISTKGEKKMNDGKWGDESKDGWIKIWMNQKRGNVE